MEQKVKNIVGTQVYEDAAFIARMDTKWRDLKNKTILITGANGFIAYYLVLACLVRNDIYNENIKIIGIVRNRKRALNKYKKIAERKDFVIIEQDVCESMDTLEHADFIIHAASQATPNCFENDPVGTLEANTIGTSNVLKYAVSQKAEAVLMISSLKVYGQVCNGKNSIAEDDIGYLDIDSYKNCYAVGKRTMETLCASYNKQYGINVKIARPSYIYGASALDDDRVWAQFLRNIVRRENILLKSNGSAYRSFCYVTDTATALLKILLEGENIVPYNIAVKHSDTTIRNFAKSAIQAFPERNILLEFANKEDEIEPKLDFQNYASEILDSSKLEKLKWKGEINLLEGIRRSVRTMEEM